MESLLAFAAVAAQFGQMLPVFMQAVHVTVSTIEQAFPGSPGAEKLEKATGVLRTILPAAETDIGAVRTIISAFAPVLKMIPVSPQPPAPTVRETDGGA